MRLRVLGSGSGGNSMAVRAGGTLALVDLGFSLKEEARRLAECGVDIGEVSAVFVTHDHVDHCRGVATFHSKHPSVPLYANGDTADAIARQTGVNDGWAIFENGEPFEVGDMTVTAFSVPHDAADPVGYLFEHGGSVLFQCALFASEGTLYVLAFYVGQFGIVLAELILGHQCVDFDIGNLQFLGLFGFCLCFRGNFCLVTTTCQTHQPCSEGH